jgi:hypothetical protein
MKTDIFTLQDLFKISYEAYEESILEGDMVTNMFHNRQYTDSQLNTLADRGQPSETFNIIKLFGRLLLGYYSTVVNAVKVSPVQLSDVITASLLNDICTKVLEQNHFETEGDKIKLDGLLRGLMACYIDVQDAKEKDRFGRVIRKVTLSHVPSNEVLLDPLSRLEDNSDARFIHRYKWVSEEQLIKLFPKKKEVIERLQAYHNHVNVAGAEFERMFNTQFQGKFKIYNNYLLVHTVITDEKDKSWSIYWIGDEELSRKEITYKEVKFPYRVHKLQTSEKAEYYGIFREVYETQKAINQALLKIQLMVNTQKAFVEEGGVEDIAEFTKQFNRVNAVIEVLKLSKIKIESLNREVLDQYTIIDKGFNRIQKVLGVNDSFLGMAFASDSGRKVKLQQNATTMSLRYITTRIEQFYRLMGWDIVNLVKQYYTAEQTLRIVDQQVGQRWIELNKPLVQWSGKLDEAGQPIMENVYEEVLNPDDNTPMTDENGNIIIAPVPDMNTEVAFSDVDISIDSVVYNDEDEKNQIMMETMLQGSIGNSLLSVNPAGFFQAAALSVKSMKTKNSLDISGILEQTSQMMANPAAAATASSQAQAGQQGMSSSLKLPQNTNEGQ